MCGSVYRWPRAHAHNGASTTKHTNTLTIGTLEFLFNVHCSYMNWILAQCWCSTSMRNTYVNIVGYCHASRNRRWSSMLLCIGIQNSDICVCFLLVFFFHCASLGMVDWCFEWFLCIHAWEYVNCVCMENTYVCVHVCSIFVCSSSSRSCDH